MHRNKHIAGDKNFMRPFVSILIPAYNAENWIADTLESAIAQTWPHKEIILVDDGSTDGTLAIARRFEPKGVRVITQLNQGAAAARNTASSLSRGDYIQWLDADDILDPHKIEWQVRKIEHGSSERTLLSGAWGYFIYRPSKARFIPTLLWHNLSPVEWLTRKMANNLHMQTDNWLVSRALTEAAGPWDRRLFRDNDGEYFCRVILASNGIQFVPDAKSYYRKAGFKSISYIGGSNKKLDSLFISMKLHVQYLLSLEDSERTRSACVAYLQTWLPEFYPNRPDLMGEAQQLAASLGGLLSLPKASWKYAWIEKLFGFRAAKHTQLYYNRGKFSALRAWDKVMYSLERNDSLPS
jgi:glycosyltransferase involved in cell wall biosynthesis